MAATMTAPFLHAETVGSLLHSDALVAARKAYDAKTFTRDALTKIEDDEIRNAVALQERVGFDLVTDGELRRNSYIDFVLDGLSGVHMEWKVPQSAGSYRDIRGNKVDTPAAVPTVFERIRHRETSPGVREFAFLKSVTNRVGKATIVGPAILHFFGGRSAISMDAYPKLEDFWADVIAAYQQELALLGAAGCTYVQFDDTSLIKLVDPAIRASFSARGDDPDRTLQAYIDVLAAVVAGAPKDMRLALHLCRGNNRGTWQAQGGYDGVAERIFERLPVHVFSLEYDSPRAGSFEPLRKLPDDKMAVLGLLSTKIRTLEDADPLIARIKEAATCHPLEQLGVSTQCGFWGGINLCTPEEAEAKLRRVVGIAREVWH